MKKNLLFITLIVASLFVSSCSEDDAQGPKGAKGESGAVGEKGDQGETGEKGDQGETGNANVKSYTKDIQNETWAMVGSTTSGYLSLGISAPTLLTSSIIKNAIILVYVESSDFSEWTLLPYYTDRNITVEYALFNGVLSLRRSQDGKPRTQSYFSKVKLVIIEPSSSGTIQRTAAVDYKDYNAVKEYYKLED